MKWVVKVVADGYGGENHEETIATIERGCDLKLDELGLTLQEGKEVLASLQRLVVTTQVEQGAEVPRCDRCERRLRTGGYYRASFRSAFGNVPLRVRRLVVCPCLHSARRTFSQLSNRLGHSLVAPEWLYLEAKCASLLPFEKVANLLGEILPVEDGRNAETVRNRLGRVGQRLHEEKIQSELARPGSGDPEGGSRGAERPESQSEDQTVVGLDGCYVRNRHPDPERLFEVIAGVSIRSTHQCERRGERDARGEGGYWAKVAPGAGQFPGRSSSIRLWGQPPASFASTSVR